MDIRRISVLNILFADFSYKIKLDIWLSVMPYNNLSKAVFSWDLDTLVSWGIYKFCSDICFRDYIMSLFWSILITPLFTIVK